MTKGITRPFEIPKEMRAVPEQARLAFNNYLQAAQEAVSSFDQWIKASQVGAQSLCNKAMNFAQRNVLSTFEFAQKIVQAKDIEELIQTQTEFVQSQIQVLSKQVKGLGEAATDPRPRGHCRCRGDGRDQPRRGRGAGQNRRHLHSCVRGAWLYASPGSRRS